MFSWSSFLPWYFLPTEQWIGISQPLLHDIDGANHVTILQWIVPTFFGRTPLQSLNRYLLHPACIKLGNITQPTAHAIRTYLGCPELVHFMAIEMIFASLLDILQWDISFSLGTRGKLSSTRQHYIVIVNENFPATTMLAILFA
jgi:hypothetical protein